MVSHITGPQPQWASSSASKWVKTARKESLSCHCDSQCMRPSWCPGARSHCTPPLYVNLMLAKAGQTTKTTCQIRLLSCRVARKSYRGHWSILPSYVCEVFIQCLCWQEAAPINSSDNMWERAKIMAKYIQENNVYHLSLINVRESFPHCFFCLVEVLLVFLVSICKLIFFLC